uniref:Uncharacterized protein n=1 Tax=Arundo donax TaxID=35708 RepID=A0A0A8Y9S9_ARUDO
MIFPYCVVCELNNLSDQSASQPLVNH